MLILILLGIPVFVSLGISSLVGLLVTNTLAYSYKAQRMYTSIDVYNLLAVPLFIFVGEAMNTGGSYGQTVRFLPSYAAPSKVVSVMLMCLPALFLPACQGLRLPTPPV